MNKRQIEKAVNAGLTVHWKNNGYEVIKYDNREFWITWDRLGRGANYITLDHRKFHHQLNGAEEDFFVSNKSINYFLDDSGNERTNAIMGHHPEARICIIAVYPALPPGPRRGPDHSFINTCNGRAVVAVWSYLPNTKLGDEEAWDLATDLLLEKGLAVPDQLIDVI